MITYRELSSLENDLGYSAKMMYSLSNSIRTHYHEASIPKGNGEYRKLYVPDEELKVLQKESQTSSWLALKSLIMQQLIVLEEVHLKMPHRTWGTNSC